MNQSLWLFFGPRKQGDQKKPADCTRSWSLLISEDKYGMRGTRLAFLPSSSTRRLEIDVKENYDLSNIPPGDEGVSGHIRLGQMFRSLSTIELEMEGRCQEGLSLGRPPSQATQICCTALVKHLETTGVVELGSTNSIHTHPSTRAALSGLNCDPFLENKTESNSKVFKPVTRSYPILGKYPLFS